MEVAIVTGVVYVICIIAYILYHEQKNPQRQTKI
jgi:hypothetical protein